MNRMFYSLGFKSIVSRSLSSIFIWGALILALSAGCKKDKYEGTYPECLIHLIKGYENMCSRNITVIRYSYNDQEVYLFRMNHCIDSSDKIHDRTCKSLCSVGGHVGNAGGCSDFFENAVQLGVIYQTP